MYLYRIFVVLMLAGSVDDFVLASTFGSGELTIAPQNIGTITSGQINLSSGNISVSGGTIEVTPNNEFSIFVDGSLFLDLSVFGDGQGISIGDEVSLKAETIGLFDFDKQPPMPDLSTTTIISNPSLSINGIGDFLIFSESPITRGAFEATANIYVGNYSSLAPVPLPASLLLFVSGIAVVGARISANRVTAGS